MMALLTAKSSKVAPAADANLSTHTGPLLARPPALGFGGVRIGGGNGSPSCAPPSVHESY